MLGEVCSGRGKVNGDGFEFRGQCHPVAQAENLLTKVRGELEEDWRRLAGFDRSVFTLHSRLAEQLGRQEEFGQRYGFHLDLQQLLRLAWDQKAQVEGMLQFLHAGKQMNWEQVSELEESLAGVSERVTEIYLRACQLFLPPLKHLKASQPLASLLPPHGSAQPEVGRELCGSRSGTARKVS